ncbi:hypothetical protein [Clostridium botulinum]|uniref:hypothetical protein n=1 Tax=Clostridium botulinum TaxID=1491 RepID=UPI00069DAE27|nr:hypothetical protein [Clostridium botulinum]
MKFLRDIDDVVVALEHAKEEGIKVNLLIGAGCSVTANIPSAEGILKIIQKKYFREYKRAIPKDYGNCMSKLTPTERRNLVTDLVRESKLNWAHIGIAQLIKKGYFHRVLTTNFDNLLIRACTLVDEYPGIYDLTTALDGFRSDLLFDKSILYLHGQYTGFLLCNTKTEVEEQKKKIINVFNGIKQKSMWIVIGYSGKNDAIWELLSEEKCFEHRLFWIGYLNDKPDKNLKEKILSDQKYSFYVNGYDADSFFVSLMKKLNCFPPQIIEKPFSHLNTILSKINKFTGDFLIGSDFHVSTKNIVSEAINTLEKNKEKMIEHYLELGLAAKAIECIGECPSEEREDILDKFSNFINKTEEEAKKFIDSINNKTVDVLLVRKLREACYILNLRSNCEISKEYLLKTIEIYKKLPKSEMDNQILTDWADLLICVSECEDDEKIKIRMLEDAYQKYKYIYEKDDKNIENIILWSELFLKMAEVKSNDKAWFDSKFNEAIQKLKLANDIDPKNIDVLIRWGTYLIEKFIIRERKSIKILIEADNKFKSAYELDKEDISTLLIWGDKYSRIIKKKVNINDKLEEYILDRATEAYKLAYGTNMNKKPFFTQWEDLLSEFIKKKPFNIHEKYKKHFEQYCNEIHDVVNITSGKDLEKRIILLNSMAFRLIENEEFEISKKLLDICMKKDTKNKYKFATLGMWYFMNDAIEENIAEREGKKFYEKCIKESDEDKNAVIQKYNLEYAKFLNRRKKSVNKAIELCQSGIQIGEIDEFKDTYTALIILKNKLDELNNEAAATLN